MCFGFTAQLSVVGFSVEDFFERVDAARFVVEALFFVEAARVRFGFGSASGVAASVTASTRPEWTGCLSICRSQAELWTW